MPFSSPAALLTLLELQLLIAADETARPALTGTRGLAAVNTFLGDRDLDTAILAVIYITFFHFTTFRHDSSYLPPERISIIVISNQIIGMCQGEEGVRDLKPPGHHPRSLAGK